MVVRYAVGMCNHHKLKYTPSTASKTVSPNDAGDCACQIVEPTIDKRKNAPKIIDTDSFIAKSREIHGELYDYSKSKYAPHPNKITISCKRHGDFEVTARCHMHKKQGCPDFKRVHGDRYDYSNVVYVDSRTPIDVICKKHGVFRPTPNSHKHGSGCWQCYIENMVPPKKKYQDGCISDFHRVHGDLYDYSEVVYIDDRTKVKIICKEHGVFEMTPNHHIRGQCCPKCRIISPEQFLEKVRKNFGDKYEYPDLSFNSLKDEIRIICPVHGEFKQLAWNHYSGKQCQLCFKDGMVWNLEQFIEKSKQIHGDLYDYSKADYKNTNTKITIICKDHGEFRQSPGVHLRGAGCQKCSNRISKPSQKWLDSIGITVREYPLPENRRMPVDGFDPKTNTVYQFHGMYYHGEPRFYPPDAVHPEIKKTYAELREISNRKDDKIRSYGYNLVIMFEYDWNILQKTIKNADSDYFFVFGSESS